MNQPLAIIVAEIIGGFCIIAIVAAMTVMTVAHVEVPPGTAALFAAVVTSFLTGVFSVVSHTVGFRNGTVNGENAAQAEALRTVMGSKSSEPPV